MKIGIVCPYDLSRSGGVQEHVHAQAARLKSRGYDVKIITPKPHNPAANISKDILFVGNSRTVKTAKTSLELGLSTGRDKIDELLRNYDFDLLHVHEPEIPILGAQIIAKADCPVVATFHALHPETAMGRTIETLRIPYSRTIFSRLRAMTAVSDAAAQFVRDRTQHDVKIVPNGIDLQKYNLQQQRTTTNNILYIGRLEKRKGVRYLLKAFQILQKQHSEVQLIIAGDGDLRRGLEDYVKDNNIKNVIFTGFIEEKEKLQLLAHAKVFCTPALYGESFGIVLLEAMASGVPVVAGDNVGYSSVLSGHGKLSLINPRDSQDFARRLDIFLHDDEIRKLWLNWASTYIKQFSYEIIIDEYEQIYQEVLQTR